MAEPTVYAGITIPVELEGLDSLARLDTELDKTTKSTDRLLTASERVESHLAKQAAQWDKLASAIRQKQQTHNASIAQEVARLHESTAQLGIQAAAYRRGDAAVQAANVSLQVRNTLFRLGVQAGSADAIAIEHAVRANAKLKAEVDRLAEAKRRATTVTGGLRNAFYGLQAVLATLGLRALIQDAVGVALALDRAQKSMNAAAGSQAAGAQEMAFVRAESERLGLVLTQTAQAYGGLAASARGTALAGQAARDIFSAVAEAGTVLGLSADTMSGALLSLQQMISKGTVQAEELRGQLSERIPGAFQIAARAMGMTTAELGKALEGGKVMASDLLPKLAAELRKTFGPALVDSLHGFQQNLNRAKNDLNELKASLGRGFLEGFLAEFSGLRRTLTDPELKQSARDLGESIGSALRNAASVAAFLADNVQLLKVVLLALVAVKVAGFFITMAGAIAKATGSMITFKAVASAPALAAGMAATGVALGLLIVVMQDYISKSRLALEVELDRVAKSQEIFGYYNTLKSNKEGLTQAEWDYAKGVRATMEAEMAALQVSLARTKAQYAASQTLNPFKYHANAGPGRNVLRERVKEGEAELQAIENQLNILDSQWHRLANLPTIKIPIDDKGLDKTAQKIREMLEGFRRAAEQAERVSKAQKEGADAAHLVTQAIERENAAYGALNAIEGLSATQKARLTAIIDAYVGRTQAATAATAALAAQQERDLQYATDARVAEAKLADAKSGTVRASQSLAAALAAEAIARDENRSTDAEFIKLQTESIRVRLEYLRSIDLEIAADQRSLEAKREKAGLEAQLQDALKGSAHATRQHAIEIELENQLLAEGVREWEPRGRQLREEVEARAAVRESILAQIAAAQRLADLEGEKRGAAAEFSDWKAQEDAIKKYGIEVAGILAQYGQLSAATKALAVEEAVLAAIRAEGVQIDASRGRQWNLEAMKRQADIRAEIQQHYDYLDVLGQIQAQHALAAYWMEPLKQGWQDVKATAKDALIEMALTGEANFEDLAKTLARTMLNAIYEMVVRWIAAHKAMQAEAMKTAAVNAAAANAGGGGGFQSTAGGLGSFNYGFGGAPAAGATGTSGAMGGLAAMGATVAIFAAIYFAGSQWIKTHKKQIASATINLVAEGNLAVNNISGNSKQIDGIVTALEAAGEGVLKFIGSLGGTMTALEHSISVRRKGQGSSTNWTVFVGDIAKNFGKDYEAALEYAAIQVAKEGQYKGLDPMVAAAIKRTTQEKWDAFQSDVMLAQQVSLMGKPAEAQAQVKIHQEVDFLVNEMLRILGPSKEFADAINNITTNMVLSLRSQRDQITGRQRTAEEEHQLNLARAHAWNAEKNMRLATVRMVISETKAKIEALKASNRMIGGGGGPGESGGSGKGGGKGGLYGASVAFLSVGYSATLAAGAIVGMNDDLIASAEAYLRAMEQIEREMAAIPDIKDEEVKKPRKGKGGGGDKDQFRDELRDLASQGLSPAAKALYDYEQQLKDLAEQQKKNKAPAAEYQAAIAAITAEFQKGLLTMAQDYAGVGDAFADRLRDGLQFFRDLAAMGSAKSGMSPEMVDILKGKFLANMAQDWKTRLDAFAGISDPMVAISTEAAKLRVELEALAAAGALSAEEVAKGRAAIEAGVEAQRQKGINSILGTLFEYLQEDKAFAGQALQFRKQEVALQFAVIRAQLAAYGVLAQYAGLVNAAEAAALKRAGQSATRAGRRDSGGVENTALQEAAAKLKEAAERLRSVTQGLEEYQRSLRTDTQLGLVNSREALDNSKAIYEEIRSKALGGDVDAMAAFRDAAEVYKRNVIGFSPSSELAASVAAGIDATLTQLIASNKAALASNPQLAAMERMEAGLHMVGARIADQVQTSAVDAAVANDNASARDAGLVAGSVDTTTAAAQNAADRQTEANAMLAGIRSDLTLVYNAILTWRIESHDASDSMVAAERDAVRELQQINSRANREGPRRRRNNG